MTEYHDLQDTLELALEQMTAYDAKPTKAESARIRKTLGTIKKAVTPVKAELLAADKG